MRRTAAVCLLATAFLLAWAGSSAAQDHAGRIDQLMTDCYRSGLFNGAVLVARADSVIIAKGYGTANMEWQTPFQPHTRFGIASITKQFTTVLILQLAEEGKLRLDDKLTDHLPDYRRDTGDRVTIDHLLQHTSGIPDYVFLPGFWSDSSRLHYDRGHFITSFISGDLQFEPGSTYQYSNSGSYLLGLIIEKVTGKSYEQNLKDRILDPLGMHASGLDANERIISGRASGYVRSLDGYLNQPYFDMTNLFSAGGIYSTVEDMLLWSRSFDSRTLLSDSMISLMFTPYFEINPHFQRAYAWDMIELRPPDSGQYVKCFIYTGGLNGFQSHIWRIPEGKYSIVLFCNTGEPGLHAIVPQIVNVLFDRPFQTPRIPISYALRETIMHSGIQATVDEYYELKEKSSEAYSFREADLNSLGYQLLSAGRTAEAVAVMRLNVAAYPQSPNAYDSYAEALMADGQTESAVTNYEKSLELNPENSNAARMLQRLKGDQR